MCFAMRLKTAGRLICALLCLCILAGCGAEKEESSETSSAYTSVQLSSDDREPGKTSVYSRSTELYADGDTIIYADPIDDRIKILDKQSGSGRTLFENRIIGEFIVENGVVWFGDAESGKLSAGNMETGEVTAYYMLPFGSGVKIGSEFYFVDGKSYGQETALYRYDIDRGIWETRVLSGNSRTPNRETVAFGKSELWYISKQNGSVSVYALTYGVWDSRKLYEASAGNAVAELVVCGDELFFSDTSGTVYSAKSGESKASVYLTGGVRVLGKTSEGVLFQKNWGYAKKLYLGNSDGVVADVEGGLAVSTYESRTLLRRASDGKERLVMVKYPEDTETFSLECSVYDFVGTERYTLAFICDSSYLYLFDMKTGKVYYFDSEKITHTEVQIEEYLNGGGALICPSEESLSQASPAQIAALFCAAFRRGDRYTMELLAGGAELAPFDGFTLKACRVSAAAEGDGFFDFTLEYDFWTENDAIVLAGMPEFIRNGKLRVVLSDGVWRVDTLIS